MEAWRPFRLAGLRRDRLPVALCVSLLAHGWAAWEMPAGGSRRPPPSPLTVRLATPVRPPAEPRSRTDAPDVAAETASTIASEAPAARRTSNRATAVDATAAPFDPTYYPPRELDDYPALLQPLAVRYPERALAEQRRGRVLIRLLVSASGKIDEAGIVEAVPEGYFEAAALEALKSAAFSAARRNGLPVRSRVLISVDFDPAVTGATAP